MGMFSWIDVNNEENVFDGDDKVILLLPKDEKLRDAVSDFFDIDLTEQGIEGGYNGYGCVDGVDVYELVVLTNVCLSSDKDFELMCRHFDGDKGLKGNTRANLEAIRNSYLETGDIEISGSLRDYGIDIACDDKDNAFIPYPIKFTHDESLTFENTDFSMGDPDQGFTKFKKSRRSELEEIKKNWKSSPLSYDDNGDRVPFNDTDEYFELEHIKENEKLEVEKRKIIKEVKQEKAKYLKEIENEREEIEYDER